MEDERSTGLLEGLRSQLGQRQHEIAECNKLIALKRSRVEQWDWKQNYYVKTLPIVQHADGTGDDYLSVLKEVQHRLKMQINFE